MRKDREARLMQWGIVDHGSIPRLLKISRASGGRRQAKDQRILSSRGTEWCELFLKGFVIYGGLEVVG